MLKKVEIGLTVVSILLGTYEVLGRTNVVSGPTPIEAVQDAVRGPDPVASSRPPEELHDLTISVQTCGVLVGGVDIDVVARSSSPITALEGVQVSATSGALTDAAPLFFDNSTTSSGWTLTLMPEPGTHTITVVVDPDDRYEEADESNNVAVVTAEVPPPESFDPGSCSPV